MHLSVMAEETLSLLAVCPDGVYLDATAGLGGHAGLIAQRLTRGMVIANDRDAESLKIAQRNTAEWAGRIRFHRGPFGKLAEAVTEAGLEKVDGLLADLGVSRYQLTAPERGFSFMADGPLDMRMDQSTGMTAADLVNHTAEKALADLIFQLGEERRARKVARAIVRARPIRSTLHLAGVVERAVPRTGRLHPATRTFMALRMAVNDEPGELDKLLEIGPELLKSGGRMVVISFMSIDDRKVKQKFKALEREGRATILTKHPLQPGEEERTQNPASRSAKLRALEMALLAERERKTMATLPTFFQRTSETGFPALPDTQAERDPFQLRALPQEDVFLYCKRIDNSRLVREADAQARGACWSAIGAACVLLVVLTGVLVPNVASTLAGYKLQALLVEERGLQAEKRAVDLQEAEMLSPQRLDKLAQGQNLVTPFPGQVVRLNAKGDNAVAMVK